MSLPEKPRSVSSEVAAQAMVVLSIAFVAASSGVLAWAYNAQHPLQKSLDSDIVTRGTILKNTDLTDLQNQLKTRSGDDDIKAEIRRIDATLRSEYFYLQRIRDIGAYILLGSVIALAVSLKLAANLYTKLPMPAAGKNPSAVASGAFSQIAIGIVALAILSGVIMLSLISAPGITIQSLGLAAPQKKPITPPFATPNQIANPWPRFRGPNGAGLWAGRDIPIEFDGRTGKNIRWKTRIDLPGRNSVIVYGNRAIVTGANNRQSKVYCYDTDSGSLAWEAIVKTAESTAADPVDVWEDVWAASTAATDGKYICAIFPTGDVACFDFYGKNIWTRYIKMDVQYGQASSLVIHKNLLLIQKDQGNKEAGESKLLALDIATGETIWSIDRPDVNGSWATPIVVKSQKGYQIICSSDPYVIAHDADTGKELWRSSDKALSYDIAPSPVAAGGRVFVAYSFTRLSAFKLDNDALAKQPLEPLWTADEGCPTITSPTSDGKIVILQDDAGLLTGYRASDGKLLWQIEVTQKECSPSPSIVGDFVYQLDNSGVMHIVKLGEKPTVIHRSNLGEKTFSSPAFQPGRIYIRGMKHIFCIEAQGSGK